MSDIDSVLISTSKGILFVFLPSLIVQKVVFGVMPNIYMIIIMVLTILVSALMIRFEKRNVKEEEITVKNGYMHTQIVLVLSVVLYVIQYLHIV